MKKQKEDEETEISGWEEERFPRSKRREGRLRMYLWSPGTRPVCQTLLPNGRYMVNDGPRVTQALPSGPRLKIAKKSCWEMGKSESAGALLFYEVAVAV